MSETDEMTDHVSAFEVIRHTDDVGGEYWSARELGPMLGYVQWRNFADVIKQAQVACENSGQAVSDHFAKTNKLITAGKGAQRLIDDWHLSRYACYLVVQNGDPSKPVIAAGQTYFAVQTRRQELADELSDELANLTDTQKRLYVRAQVAEHNKLLADAANHAGVITPRDFAIFTDRGYQGMYGGETAAMIHERKGLAPGEKILDWMGSTELAANLFRATQAEEKIRRDGVVNKDAANRTHYEVGRKVRQTIADLGGTMPEDLPTPAQSIRELQLQEQKRLDAERQPSLFDETALNLSKTKPPDGTH